MYGTAAEFRAYLHSMYFRSCRLSFQQYLALLAQQKGPSCPQ